MVLREAFVEFTAKHYLSRFSEVGDPKTTADEINTWVSEITHGKITQIITPSMFYDEDKLGTLILLNAIYFKGKWKSQFKGRNTWPKLFYSTPEKKFNVRSELSFSKIE